MDVKQLEYMVKIAEEQNISRAAEKLFITQSALNQQLLKLERQLGTPLFFRSRSQFRPTPAGEIYLAGAREMLRIKKDTYRQIGDLLDARSGRLAVGLLSGRGMDMFTSIYPEFQRQYPQVDVEPVEMSVREQQVQVAAGTLDIGFVTVAPFQKDQNRYQRICVEEIFLALPQESPLAEQYRQDRLQGQKPDWGRLQEIPFVTINRESTLRPLIDSVLENAEVSPRILFETGNFHTLVRMVQAGLCASFLPWHYLRPNPEGIAIFPLSPRLTWEIHAITRQKSYLSQAGACLIQLAAQFWRG